MQISINVSVVLTDQLCQSGSAVWFGAGSIHYVNPFQICRYQCGCGVLSEQLCQSGSALWSSAGSIHSINMSVV